MATFSINTISASEMKCFQHCGFNFNAINNTDSLLNSQSYKTDPKVYFIELIINAIIYNDVIKLFFFSLVVSSVLFSFRAIQHV